MEQHAVMKIMEPKLCVRDFPIEDRPREKIMNSSPMVLSNSELLAVILGKGTKKKNVLDLSKEIFSKYNMQELSQENAKSLSEIHGIGTAKA